MRYIITFLLASTPGLAEVPSVVTDIPPVHALVAEVMGDLGQPVLLLEPGADEHDFQLRPSQAASVAGADLVVWIGPELTPWLDSALATRPDGAATLELLGADGTITRPYAGPTPAEVAERVDDQGRSPDGTDPHAWLDPDNGPVWLGLIATELAGIDPDNAAAYMANAAAAARRIQTLDRRIAAILAPVRDKPLVTYHDAYGYFAEHYGLTVVGSITQGDASSPGARRLDDLRAILEEGKVQCIFPEAQQDSALAAWLAEGTDARIGGAIDPVGSTLDPGPGAYAALLSGLASTFADCLRG